MYTIDGEEVSLDVIRENLDNSSQCLTTSVLMGGLVFRAKSWTKQEKLAAIALIDTFQNNQQNSLLVKVL